MRELMAAVAFCIAVIVVLISMSDFVSMASSRIRYDSPKTGPTEVTSAAP